MAGPHVHVARKRVCASITQTLPLQPDQLWTLLALPESQPLFRVACRERLSESDGGAAHSEEVVFLAPVRILWWKTWARTRVHQDIDLRDARRGTVDFRLLRSDLMAHLTGSWLFEQLEEPDARGGLGSTRVTYTFAMWPKGVPVALRFMPGLLDAVQGAVRREVAQLFDKLAYIAGKVRPGVSLRQAAREAAAEIERAGGSFKCLSLLRSGSREAAAAAAAAEAAARRQLAGRAVVAHSLQLDADELEEPSEDGCSSDSDDTTPRGADSPRGDDSPALAEPGTPSLSGSPSSSLAGSSGSLAELLQSCGSSTGSLGSGVTATVTLDGGGGSGGDKAAAAAGGALLA